MSNPSKVTGGEWEVWYDKDSDSHDIVSRDHETIARCITSMDDAHLLAASKELREAGQKLMQLIDDPKVQLMLGGGNDVDSKGWKLTEALHELRQALAKADGGVE